MGARTTFRARPGGVSTVEVGTVTGDLELESELTDGRYRHRIRYAGADEWYRIEGEEEAPAVDSLRAAEGEVGGPVDPPHGSQQGRDAADPAAGTFGGARSS